jgi:hypothetical protein
VVVTEADSGRTITLAPGATLRVELHGSPGYAWTAPASGDPKVLAPIKTGADPATGNATGVFSASSAGQTEVSATQDPRCAKSRPACMMPSRLFSITVRVAPPTRPRDPQPAAQ